MPSLFKRSNGIYYISFEEEGKRRWKSTGQKYKPAALRELLEFKKLRSSYKPKVSLQAFIKDFLSYAEVSSSPKSVRLYRSTLRKFLLVIGDKLLTSITPKDVDEFRTHRLKEVSPVSVNVDLRMLRAAFYTALRWKLFEENPFKKVPLLRIPDSEPIYLTKPDFQKLLSVVRQAWLKDLIIVATCTGMRQGELLSLEWEDIRFDIRLIRITNKSGFRTKTGKIRNVPMNDVVGLILRRRFQRYAATGSAVFSIDSKPISSSYASHMFKAHVRKAGLNPKLHFHSLRHTFATWLVQEGVSIYEVQKLLGHSSISVTQVYSHLAASELHGAVNKIQVVMN